MTKFFGLNYNLQNNLLNSLKPLPFYQIYCVEAMLSRHLWIANVTITQQYRATKYLVPKRNVQVSVVGATSDIGSNVALLLKLNSKLEVLHLYDEDDKVSGVGMEIAHVPGGPVVRTYCGERELGTSIRGSDIIVMTTRTDHKPGRTKQQVMSDNALPIQQLCRAVVDSNPSAFLAIATYPINSIVPYISALLCKYNAYNPCKVMGITHIDTARSRTFIGNALKVNPREISVPVIGGNSDETIIPLFSNVSPSTHTIDACTADTLTRLVRKASTEVAIRKKGSQSAILAVAWAIHEFVDGLMDAVKGHERLLSCFTVNPHFGTRFFSGPTNIGKNGITNTCYDFPMSDYETYLLNATVPVINRDVSMGEEYVRYIADMGKSW